MKRQKSSVFATALWVALMLATAGSTAISYAQTSTNLTVTPTSPFFDGNHVTGVTLDSAPGFPFGSFASNGSANKTDMYFAPETLFGRSVLLGEIASMSYWTRKGTTHIVEPRDWYMVIYTKPYMGQLGGGWYGVRIGAEPYFAENLVDPAGKWNKWTSNITGNNQLRFYESTYNYFGSYTDPHWPAFITGTSLAGSRGPGVPYASQPILLFSLQTASNWTAGFTGQLDGLSIQLTDGSSARVNFEPFLIPSTPDACRNGGWQKVRKANGSIFRNQGECIRYVNNDYDRDCDRERGRDRDH